MIFQAPVENARQNRNRKVIRFNLSYSLNVKTKIKSISKASRKHFPRSHKFNKIFNLSIIKISYSSMPNVQNLIKQHNSKILIKDQDKIQWWSYNCRIKESYQKNKRTESKCHHRNKFILNRIK